MRKMIASAVIGAATYGFLMSAANTKGNAKKNMFSRGTKRRRPII
jgi:hypothetical protein